MAPKNVSLSFVMACLMAHAATAAMSPGLPYNPPSYDLAARLADSQGQVMECLKALQGLMSCSSLTVQFFLTGKADVAPCCSSIEIIIVKCNWPSPITSLGYTALEVNILKSLCGAVSAHPPPPPPAPKNVPPPAPKKVPPPAPKPQF